MLCLLLGSCDFGHLELDQRVVEITVGVIRGQDVTGFIDTTFAVQPLVVRWFNNCTYSWRLGTVESNDDNIDGANCLEERGKAPRPIACNVEANDWASDSFVRLTHKSSIHRRTVQSRRKTGSKSRGWGEDGGGQFLESRLELQP